MVEISDSPGSLPSAEIARAKDNYFRSAGACLDQRIRPSIVRSWRRSLNCKISQSQPALPAIAEPRLDQNTANYVRQVADEFVTVVSDIDGVVTFSDSHGTLAFALASTPRAQEIADEFPVGAQLLEELIGTNADGIAIEEHRSAQVWSGEHVLELFRGNCCTSVPVIDPINRSLIGVLTLTIEEEHAQALSPPGLLLLVTAYSERIQVLIEKNMVPNERQLLYDYLRDSRRKGNDHVMVSDGKTVITDTDLFIRASKHDLEVLLGYMGTKGRSEEAPERIMLSDGAEFSLDTGSSTDQRGTIARLKEVSEELGLKTDPPESAFIWQDLVGRNSEFVKAVHTSLISARNFEPQILFGEYGVGKSTIVDSVAKLMKMDLVKLDCSNGVESFHRYLADKDTSSSKQLAFLQRIDMLSECELNEVFISARKDKHISLVCTAENKLNDFLLFSTKYDINLIQVPSLRRRREDLPLLIEHFLRDSTITLGANLRSLFMSANWPGNIQQLRKVLAYAVETSVGPEITLRDLDSTDRKLLAHGRLSRLEEAELDQIRSAIFEADGNKSKAASILEIGRSTLYRRVDHFRRRGFTFGDETR